MPPPLAGHAFPRQRHMCRGVLFIFVRVFFPVWCQPWMDDKTDGWTGHMMKKLHEKWPGRLLLYVILVWTPCPIHRCVISTLFGSCFSFFLKLLSCLKKFLIVKLFFSFFIYSFFLFKNIYLVFFCYNFVSFYLFINKLVFFFSNLKLVVLF